MMLWDQLRQLLPPSGATPAVPRLSSPPPTSAPPPMLFPATMVAGATLPSPTSISPCPCSSRSPSTPPATSPSLTASELLFVTVGEGMPAEVEEAAPVDDQLNTTVEDALGSVAALASSSGAPTTASGATPVVPPFSSPPPTSAPLPMLFPATVVAGSTLPAPTSISACPCSSRLPSIAPASSPLLTASEFLSLTVGEGMPAEDEEAALIDHQLNTTVEDAVVDQLSSPQKTVFRAGLSMTLISILGILNPPTSAATRVNTTHATILSGIFHYLVYVSLAIGVTLMLLSIILHHKPRLIIIAKPLTEIGWASLKITLGYGLALVLFVSAPPWFALCLLFVYILTK